ncbi:hypothetical protein EFIBHEMM_03024 [Mannheimia haemolytica]
MEQDVKDFFHKNGKEVVVRRKQFKFKLICSTLIQTLPQNFYPKYDFEPNDHYFKNLRSQVKNVAGDRIKEVAHLNEEGEIYANFYSIR